MKQDSASQNAQPHSLEEMRNQIDQIDKQIVTLFEERMAVSRSIAAYKKQHQLEIRDADREAAVLESRAGLTQDPDLVPAVKRLFTCLMYLSREAQESQLCMNPAAVKSAEDTVDKTSSPGV